MVKFIIKTFTAKSGKIVTALYIDDEIHPRQFVTCDKWVIWRLLDNDMELYYSLQEGEIVLEVETI